MTSNNVLKNSNALGQSKEDIVYFKVVSNTDDFPNNDESDFRVNPYDGVEFDERFQWNASAISASIPFDCDTLLTNSIWYKRIFAWDVYLEKTHDLNAWGGVKWRLDEAIKMKFPVELANKLLMGKEASKKLPDELIKWFNAQYNNRLRHATTANWIFHTIDPILRLVDYPNSTEVDDAFEFDIKWLAENLHYPSGELMRISRTLEVLLGLNVNVMTGDESGGGYPAFTRPLPGIGIQKFTAELFWNPPVQKLAEITNKSINRGNFWRELLLHYQIPAVILKINQNYNDNDAFQGGNLNHAYTTISYDDMLEDVYQNEQFSDYFIYLNMNVMGLKLSLRDRYYETNRNFNKWGIPIVSRSPHMIGLTRGISWDVRKYVRWPIGASLNTTCDFIQDNIYSGNKEKTILHCEIPIGIKTQFPFAKFPVKLKTPLSNQMSLYNNITLSFKTSRHKRTHLKLKQNKKYLYNMQSLKKRQLRFKCYKYPFDITIKASALY